MPNAFERVLRYWPYAALTIAAAMVVLLGRTAGKLREANTELRRRAAFAYPGFPVPPLAGTTLTGAPVALGSPDGKKEVLFAFTTTCPYCLASLPAWQELSRRAADPASGFAAYGVSYDSLHLTSAYIDRHQLVFPVMAPGPARFPALYRAGAVPITLVVNDSGIVEFARVGVLSGRVDVDSVLAVATARSPVTIGQRP